VLACPDLWDQARLDTAAARANTGEPLAMMVTRKRGEREVNILAGMRGAQVDLPTPEETRLLALAPTVPVLRVRIDLNEGAHVRAVELAQALMGFETKPPGFIAARTALWGLHKTTVFDLMTPPPAGEAPAATAIQSPAAL